MENYFLLFLMVLLFVVPFTYIIIVDIIEITKRLFELYNTKLKPATITVVNSFIK